MGFFSNTVMTIATKIKLQPNITCHVKISFPIKKEANMMANTGSSVKIRAVLDGS